MFLLKFVCLLRAPLDTAGRIRHAVRSQSRFRENHLKQVNNAPEGIQRVNGYLDVRGEKRESRVVSESECRDGSSHAAGLAMLTQQEPFLIDPRISSDTIGSTDSWMERVFRNELGGRFREVDSNRVSLPTRGSESSAAGAMIGARGSMIGGNFFPLSVIG